MKYHETTSITAHQRERYKLAADSQEAAILAWFLARPTGVKQSPEQINNAVLPDAPLTSVRRALTNLTRAGELERTPETTIGRYGRPVHLWKLPASRTARQLGLF